MGKFLAGNPNYDKYPFVEVTGCESECFKGWNSIINIIDKEVSQLDKSKKIILVETYTGVYDNELVEEIKKLTHDVFIRAEENMLDEKVILDKTYPDVTDDDIFGYITKLKIEDYYDPAKRKQVKEKIKNTSSGTIIIYGTGAYLIEENPDILVYADMPRWEAQMRYRRNEIGNLGVNNKAEKASLQYKRAYFVDWRICDKLKRLLFNKWDFVLDTTQSNNPKMATGASVLKGLELASKRPFRVVPFFDPGPWGGQWMKEICNLDKNEINFAWCFDCVPEENSLLLKYGDTLFEIPSINLVFYKPKELLGEPVHGRFGDEFPIRFDFLDTMDGGNLSLQVHPLTEYIQRTFGMNYTQDESYYMLEVGNDASVYLGLKEDVNPEQMIDELNKAQETGKNFDAEKHVEKWPAKKHDHFLIPAGTVHCSGANSMVLEISATPYIFTFKLWDWGRLGLDGKPRPINIKHGKNVIQWDRTTKWTKENLINRLEKIDEGDGWFEEKTGLHEREFIETRRHRFTKKVLHKTNGSVNVLNLVDGMEAIVESPENTFEPFVVHYAETFIIPEAVNEYTIRPYGESEGRECMTIKAFVRHHA